MWTGILIFHRTTQRKRNVFNLFCLFISKQHVKHWKHMPHVFGKTELCSAEDGLGLHPVPANRGGAVSGMCRSVPDTPFPGRVHSCTACIRFGPFLRLMSFVRFEHNKTSSSFSYRWHAGCGPHYNNNKDCRGSRIMNSTRAITYVSGGFQLPIQSLSNKWSSHIFNFFMLQSW